MSDTERAIFLKVEIDNYYDRLKLSYRVLEEVLTKFGFNPKSYCLNGPEDQEKDSVVVFKTNLLFEAYHPDVYTDDVGLLTGMYDEQLHSFLSFNPRTAKEKKLVHKLSKLEKDEIILCFLQIKHCIRMIVEGEDNYKRLRDKILSGKSQSSLNKHSGSKLIIDDVSSDHIKNKKMRNEDKRFVWIESKEKLLRLFDLLVEGEFIPKMYSQEKEINKHFIVNEIDRGQSNKRQVYVNATGVMAGIDHSIVWESSLVLLMYFIRQLIEKKLLHPETRHYRFARTSLHFVDCHGKNLSAKTLTQSEGNYLGNNKLMGKPRYSEEIDAIIAKLRQGE
jgi:hypothetical protein